MTTEKENTFRSHSIRVAVACWQQIYWCVIAVFGNLRIYLFCGHRFNRPHLRDVHKRERESERDITIFVDFHWIETTWADWWVEIFTCNWTHNESHIIMCTTIFQQCWCCVSFLFMPDAHASTRNHYKSNNKKNNSKLCYFYHFHRLSSTHTHPADRVRVDLKCSFPKDRTKDEKRRSRENKIEENNESIKNPCGLCGCCWNSID